MYSVSEAHESKECVWQTQQVNRVLGRPHSHVHTQATGSDCHQEPPNHIDEVEDIAPAHTYTEREEKRHIYGWRVSKQLFVKSLLTCGQWALVEVSTWRNNSASDDARTGRSRPLYNKKRIHLFKKHVQHNHHHSLVVKWMNEYGK